MKKLLRFFLRKPNQEDVESIYPPQNLVNIMLSSIDSKTTSLEERQSSQILFHNDMVISKVLFKSDAEVVFAEMDGVPKMENLPLRLNKDKNLVGKYKPLIAVDDVQTLSPTIAEELPKNTTQTSIPTQVPVITFATVEQKSDYANTPCFDEPWISPGTELTIHGYEISKGLFYYGEEDVQNFINPLASVLILANPENRELSEPVSSYSQLNEIQKGDYLSWLSGDRDLSLNQMWCVQLYAYGLEQKIITEYLKSKPTQEIILQIYKELGRLNSLRTLDITFKKQLSSLLWIVLNMKQNKPKQLSGYNQRPDNFEAIIWANQMVTSCMSLDSTNLLKWYQFNSGHRDYQQIDTTSNTRLLMFNTIYEKVFKSDLVIPSENSNVVVLEYKPMNPNLSEQSLTSKIKDYTYSHELFVKVVRLAKEFKTYITSLAIDESPVNSELLLINSLHDDLLPNLWFVTKLNNEIKKNLKGKNTSIINLSNIYKIITSEKLTRPLFDTDLQTLSTLLYRYNYQIIPPNSLFDSPKDINHAVVYQHNNENIDVSSPYVLDLLKLMRIVLYNFGRHENINSITKNLAIKGFLSESIKDKSSLDYPLLIEASLLWLSNESITTRFYDAIIESTGTDLKAQAEHIISTVCLSANKYDPKDYKRIKEFYTKYGLSDSALQQKLRKIKIRLQPEIYSLDHESINKIQNDTDEAQNELMNIFENEDDIITTAVNTEEGTHYVDSPNTESKSSVNDYPGLNENFSALFVKIIKKPHWNASDFNAICADHDVLLNGAVEIINDWSFDILNTTLIEDDLSIDQDLLTELLGELND